MENYTIKVLGPTWGVDEWPTRVRCQHESSDDDMLWYGSERTCKVEPTTCKNEIFVERIHEYECMSCNELVPMYINDGKPNYCPHCGAKVVE